MRRRALLGQGGALAASAAWIEAGAGGGGEPDTAWLGPDPAQAHRLREAFIPRLNATLRRCQVLVVGAGVAGLTVAHRLLAAGVDVAVLDSDTQAGGNSQATRLAEQACPMGAHYLPQPGADLPELQDLLVQWGAAHRLQGRWTAHEAYCVHAPPERLFVNGAWQHGLLPPAASPRAQAQRQHFAQRLLAAHRLGFRLPTPRSAWMPAHARLDAQTFDTWLAAEGLDDPDLRWYLDYVCRDDYGAGSATVSAWAGLHYFASRHGFEHSTLDDNQPAPPVLTWPEGNAWLIQRLAAPLHQAAALHLQRLVRQVDTERHGVVVHCHGPQGDERWLAQQVVLALPLFAAQRVWRAAAGPLALALQQAAAQPRAPWLVSNLTLDRPLLPRSGDAGHTPAWDNVLRDSPALGYVHAGHQRLDPRPGPSVITHYWALPKQERAGLLQRSVQDWGRAVREQLRPAHPDIDARAHSLRLTRWGHAMAIPTPGTGTQVQRGALRALRQASERLRFAHADLAGYSVFEEAFYAGWDAAGGLLQRTRSRA